MLQRFIFMGGMWGSNPRHSEPQSDALPTELRPPYSFFSKAGAKVLLFFDIAKYFCKKMHFRALFLPMAPSQSPFPAIKGGEWSVGHW